jgi:DNA-binding CsgD family transcriptional regulator
MSTQHPSHGAHQHDEVVQPQTPGRAAELHNAERATAVLVAVSHALTGWDSFEHASERLLRDLAGALGVAAGALWLPVGEALAVRTIWTAHGIDRTALERALRPLRWPRGSALPGSAWERREPVYRPIPDADGCAAAGAPDGLQGHIALPAWTGCEVLGVVELYSASNAALNKRLMHVLGIAGHLLGTLFASRRGELRLSPLTARELEVLTLAAQGLTGRRIAAALEISPATVKTHFEHIFRKLGVSDRTAAVAQALRGGLIG